MESKEQIDKLLQDAVRLTAEALKNERLKNSQVKILRIQEKAQIRSINDEIDKLRKQNKIVRSKILSYWEKFHNKETKLVFPSTSVLRKNFRELIVYDKTALVNALDRIGRLDLVDYVFKDVEVARLQEQGKLPGVNDKTIKVVNHYTLHIGGAGKTKDRKNGKITINE